MNVRLQEIIDRTETDLLEHSHQFLLVVADGEGNAMMCDSGRLDSLALAEYAKLRATESIAEWIRIGIREEAED